MADCLIALGANLGDCRGNLRAATAGLAALAETRLIARSAWQATAPVGGPAGQGEFLNGAVRLRTSLSPETVLDELHAIEARAGRTRDEHWAARTLDLDLLLYGEAILSSTGTASVATAGQASSGTRLIVPHPRMSYRRFVLTPAVEIAGEMVHPTSGWTLSALWRHLNDSTACVAIGAGDGQAAETLRRQLAERFPDCPITVYNSDAERARLVLWLGDSPPREVLAGPAAVLPLPQDGVSWEELVAEAVAAVEAAGASK